MGNNKNIRAARLYRGFTQQKLASRCGLATGTIQQYELNKRNPKIEQIAKIAEALDLGYHVFSNGEIAFFDFVDTAFPDITAQDFNEKQLASIHADESSKRASLEEVQEMMQEERSNNHETPKIAITSPTQAELDMMYKEAVVSLMDDMKPSGEAEVLKYAKYIHSQPEYRKDSE